MNVRLLEHTPEPERTVATAARICYAPVGADELFQVMSSEEVEKLVSLIIKSGHLSAIEHAVFTFAIDGISRVCSHQLVRHRLASFNQQSQRYVKYSQDLNFITPPSIENNLLVKEKYDKLNATALKIYQELLEEGIEAEDARYVLPNSSETKMVVTMNARELLHFFSLRCCNRAQWEIRNLALAMLKEVKEVTNLLFKDAGPSCNRGPCLEGKFSCGKPWKKIK